MGVGIEPRLRVRQAHTLELDPERAIANLREQVDARQASVNLLFCAPSYDLARLGRAIAGGFSTAVVACTTLEQFGASGFEKAGITAVSLSSDELHVSLHLISPLAECQARASEAAFQAMTGMLERGTERAFGMVLVDALSGAEERLAASLHQSLGSVPLIGGCVGDELGASGTRVYHDGRFLPGAALFALFQTTLDFTTFKVSHAVPGTHKLVVTMAEPEQRLVQEFNGEPAAEAFAEALGMQVEDLNAPVFSRNPLLFLSSGEHYARLIRSVNADHSLTLYNALEVGLVLTVGSSSDPVSAVERACASATQKIGKPQIILGCNSVLRARAPQRTQAERALGDLLARHRAVGFGSYGEQFHAMYVNQTLSAVAISAR